MLFHSLAFAVLLASVLVLDRVLARALPGGPGWRVRGLVYLAASLVFYGWWDPGTPAPAAMQGWGEPLWRVRYLGLMCSSICFDWWVSRRLDAETDDRRRRAWLASSVVLQLAVLGTFKYWNFARDTVVSAAPGSALAQWFPKSDLVLPVGISFYTFQSMSYTVDVYRRVLRPESRLTVFALFVSFFPQLVAGPIVRARDFLWQVQVPKHPRGPRLVSGLERFAIGFFKKSVIADNLSPVTDPVFSSPGSFCSANNAAALLLWAVVIYCDFSGYSDMAIGCARMLGFKFLENFHYPYLARTVTEFWKRWHISLSEWLRDYLYIPLGGSRHGLGRTMFALAATMLLGGLWHGASWNFVLWGAWWGLWLSVAHLWRHAPQPVRRLPVWLTWPATVAIAVLGWAPFRCQGFGGTAEMLVRIFSPDLVASWARGEFIRLSEFAAIRSEFAAAAIALACVAAAHVWGLATGAASLAQRERSDPSRRFVRAWQGNRHALLRGAFIALLLVAGLLLRRTSNDSFIYFQF